jgi:hypothetical protein
VNDFEIEQIKKDVRSSKSPVAVIFDGHSNVCEMFAILVRWFDEERGCIVQRLLRVCMYESSVDAAAIARAVNDLFAEFNLPSARVAAAIRDGCETNTCAVKSLQVMYQNIYDVHCCYGSLDIYAAVPEYLRYGSLDV